MRWQLETDPRSRAMSPARTGSAAAAEQVDVPPQPLPPVAESVPPQAPRSPGSVRWASAGVVGAAALTVLLWASAFVGVRAVAGVVSPGALAFGRLAVASVLLGLLVLVKGWSRPSRRDLLLIGLCGLILGAGYNVALNSAAQHLDAGTVAVLVNVGPLLIALFAGLLLGEGFPRNLFLGAAVSVVGVVLIASAGSTTQGLTFPNVALCLLAAAAYAAGTVLQKPVLRRVPALPLTWIACTVGALACLPFAPELLEAGQRAPHALGWVLYLGALPTAVAFTTWAYVLSKAPAGPVGATTYLVPAVSVLISAVVLAETPPPITYAGGSLCLLGVLLTRWRPRPRLKASPSGRRPGRPMVNKRSRQQRR